jgi:preprotein translocase subunit SecE
VGALVQELFSVSLYKSSQGRVARRATMAALMIIVALGAWSMHNYYKGVNYGSKPSATATGQDGEATLTERASRPQSETSAAQTFWIYVIPLAVLTAGLWTSFRVVQLPNFADFLISVEGEMNKVSWPARGELFRASVVVMFVIFFLAAILLLYDSVLTVLVLGISKVLTWLTNLGSDLFG